MKEVYKCSCGIAVVTFEAVDIDLFSDERVNTTRKRDKGRLNYICKSCNQHYYTADYYMIER